MKEGKKRRKYRRVGEDEDITPENAKIEAKCNEEGRSESTQDSINGNEMFHYLLYDKLLLWMGPRKFW